MEFKIPSAPSHPQDGVSARSNTIDARAHLFAPEDENKPDRTTDGPGEEPSPRLQKRNPVPFPATYGTTLSGYACNIGSVTIPSDHRQATMTELANMTRLAFSSSDFAFNLPELGPACEPLGWYAGSRILACNDVGTRQPASKVLTQDFLDALTISREQNAVNTVDLNHRLNDIMMGLMLVQAFCFYDPDKWEYVTANGQVFYDNGTWNMIVGGCDDCGHLGGS